MRRSVPSVTAVCGILDKSGQLTSWAANLASDYWRQAIQPEVPYPQMMLDIIWENAKKAHRIEKQEAANIGTRVHHALEAEFKQQPQSEESDERVLSALTAARDWLKQHEVQVLQIEKRVYSRRHRFSGTLDKLALVDGKFSIIDWKTSNAIHPEHRMQTAAYANAHREESGQEVEQVILIRLPKDGGPPEAHSFGKSDIRTAWGGFLGALRLYKAAKKLGGQGGII